MSSHPIPLSVPAEHQEESMESVEDLIQSIRQLVSPEGVAQDIIDLNRPVDSPWNLSEKTLSESTNALSSFVKALEQPRNPQGEAMGKAGGSKGSGQRESPTQELLVKDLVAQSLKDSLGQWMGDHEAVLTTLVREEIKAQAVDFLRQWMDVHLPKLIKASVDEHLKSLVHAVQKKT